MHLTTRWIVLALTAAVLLTAAGWQWASARAGRLRIIADRTATTPPPIAAIDSARTPDDPTPPTAQEARPVPKPAARAPSAIAANANPQPREPQRANRKGPPDAQVRLELFWDYHAYGLDNLTMDSAQEQLIEQHPQAISLVLRNARHCRQCDPGQQIAVCQAAQAAEAAGILQGPAGFWRMHRWLVERSGRFTEPQLLGALAELGFDEAERFLETMQSQQVRVNLATDDVEAKIRRVTTRPAAVVNGRLCAGGLAVAKVKQVVRAALDAGASPSRILTPQLEGFSEQLQQRAVLATIRIFNARQSFEGSGVVVGRRSGFAYALTASHVVAGADDVEIQTFSAPSYPRPQQVQKRAEVIAASPDEDLAVVRFVLAPHLASLPIAPQLSDGSQLEVITVGCSGGKAPTSLGDQIIADELVRRPGATGPVRLWRLRNRSMLGRSGGPLIDRQGFVIGIASGIGDDQSYFSHLSLIHQFLTKSQLAWLLRAAE